MAATLYNSTLTKLVLRPLAKTLAKALGWRCITGDGLPPQAVVIGAFHTSNWDFVLMYLVKEIVQVRGGRYLGMPDFRKVASEVIREEAAATGLPGIRVSDDMGQWLEIRKPEE